MWRSPREGISSPHFYIQSIVWTGSQKQPSQGTSADAVASCSSAMTETLTF